MKSIAGALDEDELCNKMKDVHQCKYAGSVFRPKEKIGYIIKNVIITYNLDIIKYVREIERIECYIKLNFEFELFVYYKFGFTFNYK